MFDEPKAKFSTRDFNCQEPHNLRATRCFPPPRVARRWYSDTSFTLKPLRKLKRSRLGGTVCHSTTSCSNRTVIVGLPIKERL